LELILPLSGTVITIQNHDNRKLCIHIKNLEKFSSSSDISNNVDSDSVRESMKDSDTEILYTSDLESSDESVNSIDSIYTNADNISNKDLHDLLSENMQFKFNLSDNSLLDYSNEESDSEYASESASESDSESASESASESDNISASESDNISKKKIKNKSKKKKSGASNISYDFKMSSILKALNLRR
jgi:clumping factor A